MLPAPVRFVSEVRAEPLVAATSPASAASAATMKVFFAVMPATVRTRAREMGNVFVSLW